MGYNDKDGGISPANVNAGLDSNFIGSVVGLVLGGIFKLLGLAGKKLLGLAGKKDKK